MTDIVDDNPRERSDPDTELLTSYLDGELDDAETQAVERRIAADSDFRLQMQSLQKTWDLLDVLPSESADSSFTRTTMELVVDDAMREINAGRGNAWKRPLKLLSMIVLPIALFVGSFLFAREMRRDRLQTLVDVDLPVIEKSDHYLAVDQDLDFLMALHRSGLFSDESQLYSAERDELVPNLLSEPTSSVSTRTATTDNFARLKAMDAQQRESLRRKREKFENLPPEQRDTLRQFHEQITSHEKTKEFRETLNDYFDWLGTLQSRERAELADMPAEQRLKEIARTLIGRASQEFGRSGITQLPPEDARAVFNWYDQVIKNKRNEIKIRRLFKALVRKRNMDKRRVYLDDQLAKFTNRPVNQLVGVLIRVNDPDSVKTIKTILSANVEQLRPKLSPEALAILDNQTVNGKQALLLKWIEAANQARSKVTILQLQKFYEELSTQQRDELDRMSFENWEQTLKRLYRENQLSRSTETDDLSDEQGVQSLLEASGLEDTPGQLQSGFGIFGGDLTLPIELNTDLIENFLKMNPNVELTVPDDLIDDLPAEPEQP